MAADVPDDPSFLAEPHVAVLAVEHPGHAPVAVPVSYSYGPGGDLWLITERASCKARLLREAGRATVVVDTVTPRTRWVSVSCDLVEERAATDDDRRVMASRYLPAEQVEDYLAFATAQLDDEVVLVLRPGRWRSDDLTPA
jgi:hypothetical protein